MNTSANWWDGLAKEWPGWSTDRCHDCGGHGLVSDYGDGEDFYGAKECKTCGGKGYLFVSPKGKLAEYPGGPFRGQQ